MEQYQRAVRRVAEISYGLPGYTSSVFPKTLLIELPGVTQGHQDATRKLWKVMDAHLRDEFKRTRPLAVFVTPPAVFMMRDKPVRTLDDLKGLKIRVASKSAAAVISAYGATPVPMPATKVYTSMSTGVVDGALMGSDSLLIFKLIEPTRFVTVGLPEMPTTIFMVMNQQAYGELAPKNRAALDKLTGLDISLRSAAGLAKFGQIALSKFRGLEASRSWNSRRGPGGVRQAGRGGGGRRSQGARRQGHPREQGRRRDEEIAARFPGTAPGRAA